MSDLYVEDIINFSSDTVFITYRDSHDELGQQLDNIDSIKVQQHREIDEETSRIVTFWKILDPEIPTMLEDFISTDILGWSLITTWYSDEHICEWEIKTRFLEDAIRLSGTTSFRKLNSGSTKIETDGTLSVSTSKIPGVPGLKFGKINKTIEDFLVKLITPVFEGIHSELDDHLSQTIPQ